MLTRAGFFEFLTGSASYIAGQHFVINIQIFLICDFSSYDFGTQIHYIVGTVFANCNVGEEYDSSCVLLTDTVVSKCKKNNTNCYRLSKLSFSYWGIE